MKKHALLVVVFAALLFAGFEACQSTKTSTATKKLKFDLENGKGYDYEMIMNMDQEIMGQKIQLDMSTYYSMAVESDSADIKTITTSIDRFKMKGGSGAFVFEVDTDTPIPEGTDSTGEENPLKMVNKIFAAIRGQKFTMKVNAEGKVIDVAGFENMAKTLMDSLDLPEDKRKEMQQQFDSQFNGDEIKGQMERFWYIFPNKEVKIGDSWEKNSVLGGKLPGKYNSTYKVTDIEGDMVTLEEKTKVESEEEKMKLSGDITGTIVVDSRSGLVVSAKQDMKMTASAGGKSFEIKGKTQIKGKAR